VILAAQDPQVTVPSSWWEGWSALAAEPALVEFLLIAACVGVLLLINVRVQRLVREARDRAAVKDYLLGVEQALAGDPTGARQRLERVLAEDPENHHARLVYGEVLAELGQLAEAHRQHLFLQKAFKVESVRNDLGLARNLLGVGQAAEAVELARRAAIASPDDRAVLDVLFEAELAAGFPEAAARTAAALARVLDPAAQRRVRARAASALSLAGSVQLASGDVERARVLCADAAALDAQAFDVRQLEARLQLAEGGEDVRRLLAEARAAGTALPAPAAPAMHALALRAAGNGDSWTALAVAPRYRCRACGCPQETAAALCSHCGAAGRVEAVEPRLFDPLGSPSLVMDEVDANRAHVRRQLEAAVRGDPEAATDLLEIGTPAVEPLLAAAVRSREASDAVVALLRRMGPSILPALFDAYQKLKEMRLRNLAHLLHSGAGVGVMGHVVQGFGREALPYFEKLLDTTDRDLRKILVDFYIGLGDQQEFRRVLEHFAPLEVIHRLNAAEPTALRALLRTAEPGGFLAEGLLLEPVFQRQDEIVRAIAEADQPDVLVTVLQKRGYDPHLSEVLVGHLADPVLGAPAGRILDSYGMAALDHLLSAFADLDRDEAIRGELKRRISAMGARVVSSVARLFGPSPSSIDDDAIDLLVQIGSGAAEPLVESYTKTSLVERLGGSLFGRYTHRRVMIIRALGGVGGWSSLERLRHAETDPNLKLRLAQALQARRPQPLTDGNRAAGGNAEPEDSHGQVG
jgi:hypothetical protein